jgi:hemoglobin
MRACSPSPWAPGGTPRARARRSSAHLPPSAERLLFTLFAMPDPFPSTSLFHRLGGRPKLLQLLKYFYADVRQHREIGPIFVAQIENWPAHLEKIADFWSGVCGGPVRYAGNMPSKHMNLGIEERHFQAWLDLWARHCRAHLAPAEAGELIAIAETIGRRLRQIVSARMDSVSPPSPPPVGGINGPASG